MSRRHDEEHSALNNHDICCDRVFVSRRHDEGHSALNNHDICCDREASAPMAIDDSMATDHDTCSDRDGGGLEDVYARVEPDSQGMPVGLSKVE